MEVLERFAPQAEKARISLSAILPDDFR